MISSVAFHSEIPLSELAPAMDSSNTTIPAHVFRNKRIWTAMSSTSCSWTPQRRISRKRRCTNRDLIIADWQSEIASAWRYELCHLDKIVSSLIVESALRHSIRRQLEHRLQWTDVRMWLEWFAIKEIAHICMEKGHASLTSHQQWKLDAAKRISTMLDVNMGVIMHEMNYILSCDAIVGYKCMDGFHFVEHAQNAKNLFDYDLISKSPIKTEPESEPDASQNLSHSRMITPYIDWESRPRHLVKTSWRRWHGLDAYRQYTISRNWSILHDIWDYRCYVTDLMERSSPSFRLYLQRMGVDAFSKYPFTVDDLYPPASESETEMI